MKLMFFLNFLSLQKMKFMFFEFLSVQKMQFMFFLSFFDDQFLKELKRFLKTKTTIGFGFYWVGCFIMALI